MTDLKTELLAVRDSLMASRDALQTEGNTPWNVCFALAVLCRAEIANINALIATMGDSSATIAPVSAGTVQPITDANYAGVQNTPDVVRPAPAPDKPCEISVVNDDIVVDRKDLQITLECLESRYTDELADCDRAYTLQTISRLRFIVEKYKSTKPVSVDDAFNRAYDFARRFPRNGLELKEFCKAVLDAAGVKYAT